MKANELRIGNWVYIPQHKENKQIGAIYENGRFMTKDFQHSFSSIECASPIPLSEEWLLKFGFEKKENGVFINNIAISNTHGWFTYNASFYEYDNLIDIDHVHQLQNLYFSLIGEELTINETP